MSVRWVIFTVATIGLNAQSLSIDPSTVSPNRMGSLLIRLNSPDDKAPVAMQWDLVLPSGVVVDQAGIVAGSAAESAEKSITCIGRRIAASEKRSIFACILAGGQKKIRSGTIALFRYRIATAGASFPVQIERALGTSVNLETITFPKVEGTITVP